MEHVEKKPGVAFPAFRIVVSAIIYLALYLLAASSGMIHPACFAYAGTVLPILFAFVYLSVASTFQRPGAAAILNGFVLVVGLILGEGNLPLVIGLIVFTALAEIIRGANGYDTLKGVRLSFLPFAFSFYAYSAHWWTDTEGSLAAAVQEMPAGYADRMAAVISRTPVLIVMLILVIPVAVLGMRIAERVMKRRAGALR